MSQASPLHEIVARLGGDLSAGGAQASVPGPGHSRADRSLSLRLTGEGRVIWYSHANDPPDAVWNHLGIERQKTDTTQDRQAWERMKAERAKAEAAERKRKLDFCAKAWGEAVPAEGSPVATYLRSRRGLPGPIPDVLRYHPAAPLDYDRTRFAAAMVALVHGPGGIPSALHLTLIKPDGSDKRPGNSRLIFGYPGGGAVRLCPIGEDGALAVAEGVETAWAFGALRECATWATLNTSGLAGFKPPFTVRELTIAADSDDHGAGHKAASTLATACLRRCSTIIAPAPDGQDWADVLQGAQ